jgi:TrmH family RNA methyltransferase
VVGTTAVRNRRLQQPLYRLDEDQHAIQAQLVSGHVALLFGSEKIGLTNEDFAHCHRLLHIPTEPDHISMNLAQSVAVCLYELSRAGRSQPQKSESERATAGANEQITEVLLESLYKSGYVKPGNDVMCEKKVRRLILGCNLNALDAKVLLGMVRQIAWKLKQSDKG